MKESYMWFVILAVIITPFLPSMIKGKCPNCHKRKLEPFEPDLAEPHPPGTYISYFLCRNCEIRFQRDKSGPLIPLQADKIPDALIQ